MAHPMVTLEERMSACYQSAFYKHCVSRGKTVRCVDVMPVIPEYRGCGCGETDEARHELLCVSRYRYEVSRSACDVAVSLLSLYCSTIDINIIQ